MALLLEYLKVLLTWPVVVAVIAITFFVKFKVPLTALIDRTALIKIPGGAEFSAPLQSAVNVREDATKPVGPLPPPIEPQNEGQTPTVADEGAAQQARSEREKAALWEYRYLNNYLVPNTQIVLDWLAERQPTTYGTYDAWIMPSIYSPTERAAIISALENHYLVNVDRTRGNLITVSPKGHEYREWRGPIADFLRARLPLAAEPPSLVGITAATERTRRARTPEDPALLAPPPPIEQGPDTPSETPPIRDAGP